jgi:predicted AAA+ superfamily ATPase
MYMIKRKIMSLIEADLFRGKAILLYGARQTGKTTLVRELLSKMSEDVLSLNGDEPDVRELLENISSTIWKNIIGNTD